MGGSHGGSAIECDRCGTRLTGLGWNNGPTGPTPGQARAEAEANGWNTGPNGDLCPTCAPPKPVQFIVESVAATATEAGAEQLVLLPDHTSPAEYLNRWWPEHEGQWWAVRTETTAAATLEATNGHRLVIRHLSTHQPGIHGVNPLAVYIDSTITEQQRAELAETVRWDHPAACLYVSGRSCGPLDHIARPRRNR